MTDYIGADGQSYPEVASRAVRSVHEQHRSPLYGYIRKGINQKIYLFPVLEDARAWFGQHVQLQPDHDYAAVFAATDLSVPVAGMEHFMRANVSGDVDVGSWWPFFLGLPLGGLGGYFLRRWQEPEGARAQVPTLRDAARPLFAPGAPPPSVTPVPKTSGDYVGGPWLDMVGGPWLDMVGQQGDYSGYGEAIGGPWLDIEQIGAQYGSTDAERRRAWPQTKALIDSAIADVTSHAASYPAEAYVWSLDAPMKAPYAGRAPDSVVTLEGTTNIVPFSSQREALNYLREVAQTRPVALAMFERSSSHWPNPVAWRKSDDPEHEPVIAQRVARQSPTQASGDYVGADTVIGAAIDDVRRRAQTLAGKRAGKVIGIIHTSKDGLWHTLAFSSEDDADDWIDTATQSPAVYTYAAYFNKADARFWPNPVIEKVSGMRAPPGTELPRRSVTSGDDVIGEMIGALIDDYRSRAKQIASQGRSAAAGALLSADKQWHVYAFTRLDDAIDWLQQATQKDKSSFIYAAAFEKGNDGTAYIQDEEVGIARTPAPSGEPIRREVATTSGDDAWWAA